MNKARWAKPWRVALVSSAFFFLVSCGIASGDSALGDLGGAPKLADPEYQRSPPPVAMPTTPGTNQVVQDDGQASGFIDMSNVADGYVAASCSAGADAKFRVTNGDYVYDYDLESNGDVEFFPLAAGDGYYTFNIFLHASGDQYSYFLQGEASVALKNEQTPFLFPNKIVNYTPNSEAVEFSYTLAEHASTDLEVIQQVHYWMENNITYDSAKAGTVQTNSEYLPDVDSTLESQTGICYDYAALMAAMMRANGIPCKLIMGYANNAQGQQILHAWNMVWTEEEGWIATDLAASPNEWVRVDLTFASSGDPAVAQFVADGSNYADMSAH